MMLERDPSTYSLLTYAWVFGISMWGGIASYVGKVRDGHTGRFSITELIGEVCTSAFSGVMTFYLCELAELDPLLTAAFVGIAGHMGSRAIFVIEKYLRDKWC